MVITKVTMNNTTACMSNHTAAALSAFLVAAMAGSKPEDYQRLAKEVNERYGMNLNEMDVLAAVMQVERVLDRTISDLTKMVKEMHEAYEKEKSEEIASIFGKKNGKVTVQ
jgi:uncharacterized protein YfbU (UPF0304 family)